MGHASRWGLVASLALVPWSAMAATCPPDGNAGLLPTFDAEDRCGSYDQCTALALANKIEESKACAQKFDDCAVAVNKANAVAEAHNAALEACRTLIPARPKETGGKPSPGQTTPSASSR
jgi:hypothetical protein